MALRRRRRTSAAGIRCHTAVLCRGAPMNDVVETPLPKLPHALDECAFLLDVDGTLLDLAPTPREVYVSKELRQTLQKLYERTGGATAFVSGRPVEELDLIFAPLQLPAVGGHGCEF